MLKKSVAFTFILIILLCFSSCFQIIEEINLKNDGSGEAKITLNLSQSKSKVASLLLLDSVNGYKVPDEKDIQKYMHEAVAELKKNAGISNVKQTLDMKTYIATISFNFKNIVAVNDLISNLLKKQKTNPVNFSKYSYDRQAALFKRDYAYSPETKKEFNKLKPADRDIFKTASYTGIFRFENTILLNSNRLSKLSPSGKAVMQTVPLMDLINGNTTISNTIKLAK